VDWLPLAEFAYNNAVNETTGFSPFFLNKGQHPWALPDDPVAEPGTPAEAYLKRISDVTEKAEASLYKVKEEMKKRWDQNKRTLEEFEAGDLVFIMAEQLLLN
jgi:hypothetical protein